MAFEYIQFCTVQVIISKSMVDRGFCCAWSLDDGCHYINRELFF